MVERNQSGSVRWTFSFVTYQRYDVIFSEKQTPQLKQECVWLLSHVQLFSTPWTVTRQAPRVMEFFRQEY